MLTKVKTVALDGMKGELVEIETDISNGLPYFSIIGMADTSVRESSQRVKRALINSGFDYPKGKITVNLSPAYIHKKGSHYDLGIAVGLILSQKILLSDIQNTLFIGELSLDGKILPAKGVLPMIMSIIEKDNNEIKEIILPVENCNESYLFTKSTNVNLIPVSSLKEVIDNLKKREILPFKGKKYIQDNLTKLDFLDVKGHDNVKEAIMIAVAGNHNLLMIGPPGTGKTMLAKRIVSILTPMSLKEQIETTKVYSYAGKLTKDCPIINERPFRHLNQGITKAALIGGGVYPMPGEVSFAHNGVLFIDEMLELPERVLENLRTPMEDKEIHIARKGNNVIFPSKFLLIGATNPCKCGFLGDSNKECTCTQGEINQYRSKLSGALADRIDMAVEVSSIDYQRIHSDAYQNRYTSENMRKIVSSTCLVQEARYDGLNFSRNGDMDAKYIDVFCRLNEEGYSFMKAVYENHQISMRRYHKILKIAKTIADIRGKEILEVEELSAAFHYTRFLTERGR